jgi:hypothetical protein
MSSKLQLLEFYTTHDLKSSDLPVSKFHPASSIYYTLSNQVLGLVDRKSKSLTFPTKTLEPMYIKTYDHEHRDDGDDDGTYYFKIRPYNHDILVKYHDGRMFTREGDNMVQFLPYQQDFRASAMRTASLIDVANVKYISVGGSNYVITTTPSTTYVVGPSNGTAPIAVSPSAAPHTYITPTGTYMSIPLGTGTTIIQTGGARK